MPFDRHSFHLPIHQLQCNSKLLHTVNVVELNHLSSCKQVKSILAEEPN